MKNALIFITAMGLSACVPQKDDVSYAPQVSSVTQGGLVYYGLNCREGDLQGCNQIAINHCGGARRRVKVTNHFVSGSQVKKLTFYCTTGKQQLVPENITFDSGSVVR